MMENEAQQVAQVLGGSTWNSGGDVWLVVIERSDGCLVALSDEVVCEYANREELQTGQPTRSILLA